MKARSLIWVVVLICMLAHGCVEPFDIKSIRYDNVLVIEGHISNADKPQQVKLSRTAAVNHSEFIAESGAHVEVESESGETFELSEVEPGIYESASFSGIIGKGYTLAVKTSNGREYRSNQVVLKDVPAIASIDAEFVTAPERGIRILINTEDPRNATHYYRWDYIETYEILTPFPSNYVVLPGAAEATWREERVDQCWASDTLRTVLIKSTLEQNEDKVVGFPLRFISEDSYVFRVKYSMLVQQFAMSEEAYNYWENIRILNETQGTLSDVQPGTLNSNVTGLTDPNETVLGYFDASAVSEQRVFFNYRDFESAGYIRPPFRNSCKDYVPILVKETLIADYMLKRGDVFSIWDVVGVSPTADFELLPKSCCDCTAMGTNVKPSFWK